MGKGPTLVLLSRYLCLLSVAKLYRRYKNRLQLGPETRCVGVDMNRYAASNLSLNVLTNSCFYDRNWVGFLIRDLTVPVI